MTRKEEHTTNILTHDITIGSYHTRKDFHLIPVRKPVVQPPIEKTVTLEVPGASGQADLSHSLTGYPVFKEREGSWEFYLEPGVDRVWYAYQYLRSTLARTARRGARVVLDDEPSFYYLGAVWAGGAPSYSEQYAKITLNYRLYPFKFLAKPLETDWLWDEFNFETDLAPARLGSLVLDAADTAIAPVRLPATDRPALLKLCVYGADVNFVLRYNGASGAVVAQGVLREQDAYTDILLQPAANRNGGMVDIYYLTLTKAAGSAAEVRGSYEPGYL